MEIIRKSGFELVEDLLVNEIDFSGVLEDQKASIKIRTSELKDKYPDKVHLFEQYMESQIAELNIQREDLEVENARLTAIETVKSSDVASAMASPSEVNYTR